MTNKTTPNALAQKVVDLRHVLCGADPNILAMRIGAKYVTEPDGKSYLDIPLWSKPVHISFPDLVAYDPITVQELSTSTQALLLYHLVTSDGAPLQCRWVSFAELPGGRFYNQAFQGYSGNELVRAFGNDIVAFSRACIQINGITESTGDAAFRFEVLPRLPVLLVYWQGDEDFPPSIKVLFDASACHHVPVDVCAMVGGALTGKLIRVKD